MHRPLAASVDGDMLVAYFPAMAVRAVEHALRPHVRDAGEIGKLVAHAVREQHPRGSHPRAVPEAELEAAIVNASASRSDAGAASTVG